MVVLAFILFAVCWLGFINALINNEKKAQNDIKYDWEKYHNTKKSFSEKTEEVKTKHKYSKFGQKEIIQAEKEEAEARRKENIKREIKSFLSRYSPQGVYPVSGVPASKLKVKHDVINETVVDLVKRYKETSLVHLGECYSLASKIWNILNNNSFTDEEERYIYLKDQQDTLDELDSEYNKLVREINSNTIQLLNEDWELIRDLRNAFESLLKSKKCVSSSKRIDGLIVNSIPKELGCFNYDLNPVVLYWNNFYYCLFSNLILVFDSTGVFSTALDPSVISVSVERKKVDIYIRDGQKTPNEFIANDSNCIKTGVTRSRWMYQRNDGGPDLRYNGNYLIEYRTDTYEYAIVTIKILDNELTYTASSKEVAPAFEKVINRYFIKRNKSHNPIPVFMNLLESVSEENNAVIGSIKNELAKNKEGNNYFCKIVKL